MSSTIEEIASILGAQRIGTTSSTIDWILTDSRSLCFPEETLFFALKTKRNDGHKYIPDLYQKGVRNFVVNEIPEAASSYTDANFLIVPNPLKSLQRLASKHREQFQVPVIGITGSNGKTVVKEWLYQILSPDRTITRSPRSYNSQIGVPLSVWLMNEHTELGIFEAGISEMGEMEALRPIIQPTIGIRKALGAKPLSILWLIIVESVAITTLFGYIGMVAGIAVTEWMNSAFGNQTMDAGMFQQTMFSNPTVDLSVAIQATLTLIIAGTLAGFFPAKKAVSISPIEALRAD